jgi:hypothetical protein
MDLEKGNSGNLTVAYQDVELVEVKECMRDVSVAEKGVAVGKDTQAAAGRNAEEDSCVEHERKTESGAVDESDGGYETGEQNKPEVLLQVSVCGSF